MDGDDIKDENDYFAYGNEERQLSVAYTTVTDTIDYQNDAAFEAIAEGFPGDHFIGQWTGLVVIEEGGSYTFSSTSDDGSPKP